MLECRTPATRVEGGRRITPVPRSPHVVLPDCRLHTVCAARGERRMMTFWSALTARWADGTRSDSGAALVEMAVISPLLLVMVLGVGDFGRVLYTAITLSHAARAGAAYGAQSTGYTGDTGGIQLAAEEEAQNIAPIGVTSQRVCECTGGAPVSCTISSCGSYGAPRAFVEVTTTRTFQTVSPYPGLPDTVALSRTAKVRVQ